MRKFSKILAVLLAVCVIFGIVAMTVSGETATNQLDASQYGNGSNINNYHYFDNPYSAINGFVQIAGTHTTTDKVLLMSQGSKEDNSYARLALNSLTLTLDKNGKCQNNSASFFVDSKDTTKNDYRRFPDYAYHVFDFDLTSDAYVVNGELDYTAESGQIAYPEGLWFSAESPYWQLKVFFVKDENGVYYLSAGDTTLSDNDYRLPTEKDVWTHVTYVTDSAALKTYIFINGDLFTSYAVTSANGNRRVCFNPQGADPFTSKWSIGVDNLTSNHYEKGYTSGDKFGVDDYIAAADFTKPLYICEDIVYNKNYTYVSAVDGQYSAVIDTVAGEPEKYLFVEDALEAIAAKKADEINFANITVAKSLEYTPCDNLKSLTFIAKAGAVVTIPQEARDNGYTVSVAPNADGTVKYTVKMAEAANVVFIDDNGNVLTTKQSPIGAILKTLDVQVPVTLVKKANSTNTYKVLKEWVMKDGDGQPITFYGNNEKILSDYVFYATDVYTPGVNSIVVKATYEEKQLAFSVLTDSANALILNSEINSDTYTDTANLVNVLNAAEEDVNIVLHDDATIAATNSIVVNDKATLDLDLNGNVLSQINGTMFIIGDQATLNVKSSESGAELYQGDSDFLIAATDDAYSYNINIVGEKDKEIAITSWALIDAKGGEFDAEKKAFTATDKLPAVINISGVAADVTGSLWTSAIKISTTELELNITDSVIINESGRPFIASDSEYADAKIAISSSTIANVNEFSYEFSTVFGALAEGVSVAIVDTEITGDVFAEKIDGTVTVGANTKFELGTNAIKYTEIALVDDLALAENCIPVRANLYNKDLDVYFGIVILDETDAEAMANVVTVTWLDPNGEVFAVEEWFKGSTAVGYDTNDFGVLTDTKNGWYTLGYASWEDENAVDLKYNPDYKFDKDVTFRPVKGLVASVAVKVNMSLLTKFEANLYIPLYTPENVQILGLFTHYDASYGVNYLYSVDESTIDYAYVDGMDYAKHSFFFDNSDVDKAVTRYLAIKVDGVVMVQKITVDLLGYAESVMEQYGCGSEEAVLAYNLINYANEAYEYKNGVEYAPATEFLALEEHDEECCCAFGYDYDLDEVSLNYKEGLGDDVYGVSYDISNEMPAFILYANTDVKTGASLIKKVKVQFYGINGSVDETEYDYNLTLVRGEDVVIDNSKYATFSFKSMPLYNAAEVMTITVTDIDGNEFSGTYSLATYIDHFTCYPAEGSGLDVAKALYSFAKVASDYKNLAD